MGNIVTETSLTEMVCARPSTALVQSNSAISEVRCLHRAQRILKENTTPDYPAAI